MPTALVSQSGDDILIGGLFLGIDLTEARRAALLTVSEEWSSGDSFAERSGDPDPRTSLPLVEDDGVADTSPVRRGTTGTSPAPAAPAEETDVLSGNSSQDVVTPI